MQREFRALDFSDALRAFDLKVLVVEPAKQFAFVDFIADIDRELGDATVHFGSNGNLVCGADVAGGVDNKSNIARLNDGGGWARGGIVGCLDGWPMAPKEIASGAETGKHD